MLNDSDNRRDLSSTKHRIVRCARFASTAAAPRLAASLRDSIIERIHDG